MNQPPRVVFCVAAGPRIGFGHLMRCRALAQALGTTPIVSIRGSRRTRATAESLGCQVRSNVASLADADMLVVDDPSTAKTEAWLRRARRAGVPTTSIHDGGDHGRADLVVDGSICAAEHSKSAGLLGTAFTILDARVAAARGRRLRRTRTHRPARVLIALGGGSYVFSIVPPLVRQIARRCPAATIFIAAGFSRPRPCPRVAGARWLRRSNGLARDLAACDVAVVAGGLTLYEACAIGVPAVGLAVVPAQRRAIAAFTKAGAIVDGGLWDGGDASVQRTADHVVRLLRDQREASARAVRASRLVDGCGARRVADRILALARGRVRVTHV